MIASKKIVLIGHFGVGKTSLIRRFVENTFSEDYKVTIGVHISKKTLELSEDQSVSFIIWDLEGQDDIKKTRVSYLLGTHAFIYVFDLSRPSTFENLKSEINYLHENYSKIPLKVVGNKVDLVNKEYLTQYNDEFDDLVDLFVSAKNGSRVESLFSKLAKELI
ncbi:Rab family GTPase [Algibacter pectinivorans]|uniref:Small GTP-binding protein domain-containing protein n=1 Tax=Algibacter pectinivorans TaxID=870482 RepID=A0A1I1QB58_9FLAO|nr:Rab family GTPase [Algibacter pectinivorans]SFD17068.1 small GTP-binding protein domain-containing protein [Algibacter pectinivorans]